MRFVTLSLVSYAGATIVMIQAVDRLVGADRYSCMCLENISGGPGGEFDAFEGVHIIPRCDHLLGPPRYPIALCSQPRATLPPIASPLSDPHLSVAADGLPRPHIGTITANVATNDRPRRPPGAADAAPAASAHRAADAP